MARSHGIAVLVVALMLAAGGGTLARWQARQPGDAAAFAPGDDIAIAHPLYDFDPTDDRALANYATDIFVGDVLGQTGASGAPTSATGQEVPQTQFAVDVVQTIKGDAVGVVTVNQVGGFDTHARQMMLLDGDALLRPGASELFLVSYIPAREWYQIVAAGHGHLAADEPALRQTLFERFMWAMRDIPGVARGRHISSVNANQPAADTIDFITFNGAVYLSTIYLAEDSPATPFSPIADGDLGPVVGQVITTWIDANAEFAYPNEPCSWDTADGAAPRLAAGDRIYAVRGYATTFRLAARQDGELVSYQVWCNDEAEVGADLFDIYDRVERISVTEDLSESSGWAVIDDRATVDGLVGMLLQGAVIPEALTSTAPITHQMIIHLDDGTTFRASAAPEEFLWGLGAVAVPAEFTETLHRAWTGR